jgi:hypothetical protein
VVICYTAIGNKSASLFLLAVRNLTLKYEVHLKSIYRLNIPLSEMVGTRVFWISDFSNFGIEYSHIHNELLWGQDLNPSMNLFLLHIHFIHIT